MITENIKSNLISTAKNTIKLSKYLRIKKIEGGGFSGKKIEKNSFINKKVLTLYRLE